MSIPNTSIVPLWTEWRDRFPVTRELIYLNHAAVSPLCPPAAEEMKRLADEVLHHGSHFYATWETTYANLRQDAATLINARKDEIAITKNTSEGLATIANGIAWRSGDKIVGFKEEFPANYFPWKRLEARGVRVEWLSVTDPLDRIDEACRGARLLAISFVQYLSGYRADLEAIGEICARHGALYVVDAIQGLGAFPVDVRKARIHALASDGHKWLLGPEGCGILYIQKEIQDHVEPLEIGWTNFASQTYGNRNTTLRADASRYECGTLNTIGCYGLRAAIRFLLDIGVDRIAAQVQAHAARLADGAGAKGYEILGPREPSSTSGIVSFRTPRMTAQAVVGHLRKLGIETAPREGWVRTSPHFYLGSADIERTIEALP
ncbi:MAG TPA: aminotransferase class V-fold PLP-dependent enzyme [Bryobacteraceae bacterium]|nr:aminotransferase class V-fold PLP-dependent enzyme [Bryobacteraceae bacterium]